MGLITVVHALGTIEAKGARKTGKEKQLVCHFFNGVGCKAEISGAGRKVWGKRRGSFSRIENVYKHVIAFTRHALSRRYP